MVSSHGDLRMRRHAIFSIFSRCSSGSWSRELVSGRSIKLLLERSADDVEGEGDLVKEASCSSSVVSLAGSPAAAIKEEEEQSLPLMI